MFQKNKQKKEQSNQKSNPDLLKVEVQSEINTAGKVGKSHHEYFKVMDKHAAGNQNQPITVEELAAHNTLNSAWISLSGTVYDVTVYINYHPGGKILLDGCGKESVALFNQYHPWVNWKYLLEKYRIGYLTK